MSRHLPRFALAPVLPLTCLAWLVTVFLATAQAQQPKPRAEGRKVHADLSLFSHSDNCVACHNGLTTPSGEDVSIGSTWRSTMMANSARDPYWQAGVRREIIDHPKHSAAIQDECAACHMPMSTRIERAAGGQGQVLAHLPIAGDDSPLHRLAADSISCTVCHQIAPDRLGTRESFNSNFVMRPTPANGARAIFGPYAIDAGHQTIMRSVTGFVQAEAPHVKQSELCASCHTLITEAYGPDGEVIGSLPEQMNYQEWQHSDFNREQRSCQSCHMPKAEGPIRASSVLGDARDTLSRHLFVGGNAFMVRLLNRYRTELGVDALPAELDATAKATIRQLQQETAEVGVSEPRAAGGTLAFDVRVRNLTGHKFPTGYPSRRTWLHVTARDAGGGVVFESGAIENTGAITGNDADRDPATFEPHYEEITRADQVQIYEPVLGDRAGLPTTGLLSAVRYLKDNRLLPRGFDKETAAAEIGVYGGAGGDADFMGGGDRVRYRVAIPAGGPYRVEVQLLYQPIAYRWAHNLERYDAPEPARFLRYYNAGASGSSVVVATAAASTGGGSN
ncbi:MAG TPA: hypothetical protein VGQ37_12710 [Vicinamibacterales bacterium]|jgi:hypothetical protein|nr:hypothetical protein [Vicinamibacterales bacterium]